MTAVIPALLFHGKGSQQETASAMASHRGAFSAKFRGFQLPPYCPAGNRVPPSDHSPEKLPAVLSVRYILPIHEPSRSDFQLAEHKKSSSGAAWIFCMKPNCKPAPHENALHKKHRKNFFTILSFPQNCTRKFPFRSQRTGPGVLYFYQIIPPERSLFPL